MTELLTSLERGVQILKTALKTMPLLPGVYRMINAQGDVLYVGKALSLKKRVVSYTLIQQLPNRLQRMVSEIDRVEITTTYTEIEALLLESNLIKKLQPRYNILLKDDKSYPFILLTKDHDFPRVAKHRGVQKIKGNYFGPFASVMAVDETILSLQRIFQIRNCTDSYFENRDRPCLQYDIKRCTAPCVRKVSKADYAENVKQAIDFLKGKTDAIQRVFAEKMQKASEEMRFEDAGMYRDRIQLLTHIQSKQRINISGVQNTDVLALYRVGDHACVHVFFYRHGRNYGTQTIQLNHTREEPLETIQAAFITQFYSEHEPPRTVLMNIFPENFDLIKEAFVEKYKTKVDWEVPKGGVKAELVEHALSNAKGYMERKFQENASMIKIFDEIKEQFFLSQRPERIEIYDNSHIQGSDPYGVMVVATQEGFDKKSYRKFAIKTNRPDFGGDDFSMMREVMLRRFSHVEDWGMPSLLLIDGGVGQINAVLETLESLNISVPVVGISKGPDRNAGREQFHMRGHEAFMLNEKSPTLYFLQRIRDEAHRFAIGTHRAKREKNIRQSVLDEIPGIGASRKKLLLQHFGSAQDVKRAGLNDLMMVKGISQSIAEKIYNYFH